MIWEKGRAHSPLAAKAIEIAASIAEGKGQFRAG
jgi:hypothetical protein